MLERKLKISTYGVEEMTQKELMETNGGIPWIIVIGIAVDLLILAYTIYRDNRDPEECSCTNQLPDENDSTIINVIIHNVIVPVGYDYTMTINADGSTTITVFQVN